LTFLLLPSLDVALARAQKRNARIESVGRDEGRFEQQDRAFYQRVEAKYREIAARETGRVLLFEGDHSLEETQAWVLHGAIERLRALGHI
jgi:dTMP kinase